MTYKRKEVIGGLLKDVSFTGFPRNITIYGIGTPETVYVGSTNQTIESRIRAHVSMAVAGSDTPIHIWMMERKCEFDVIHLETCAADRREERERYWISHFGDGLLNVTDGGPGMSGNLFAGTGHAEKIANKLRLGTNFACEVCGVEFWRKPRDIKLGNTRFCSRACYQFWQKGKPKRRVKNK